MSMRTRYGFLTSRRGTSLPALRGVECDLLRRPARNALGVKLQLYTLRECCAGFRAKSYILPACTCIICMGWNEWVKIAAAVGKGFDLGSPRGLK